MDLRVAMAVLAAALPLALAAMAQTSVRLGPAPSGNPAAVAHKAIREQFDSGVCLAVSQAARLFDGSIRAVCSDAAVIRIYSVRDTDRVIAMRCMPPPGNAPSLC